VRLEDALVVARAYDAEDTEEEAPEGSSAVSLDAWAAFVAAGTDTNLEDTAEDIVASWDPCAEDSMAGSQDVTSYEAVAVGMNHHAAAEEAAGHIWAWAAQVACGSGS
jgi:hypothetical protein